MSYLSLLPGPVAEHLHILPLKYLEDRDELVHAADRVGRLADEIERLRAETDDVLMHVGWSRRRLEAIADDA